MEIPVREKYLHHQVKKVSSKNSGTSGSSKKNRHLPTGNPNPPRHNRQRVMVMEAGTGRIRWAWR